MSEPLHILFGWAFTVAFCWAAGILLLDRMRIRLYSQEEHLIGFLLGSAGVSWFTFALCLVQQARRGVFLWTGLGLIVLAVWRRRRNQSPSLPKLSSAWFRFFLIIFSLFFVVYFFNAMAPEVSPDGSGYHLGNVNRYWRAHGFVWDYHNMYAYLSHGMEMLFLIAYGFGRHSAAAMVHMTFQAVLPWLMVAFGRRTGHARPAVVAAVIVYASPVVGIDGISAYNDMALAAALFGAIYILQVWEEERQDNLLLIIGILCGFCFAVKYTAAPIGILAAGLVLWRSRTWKPAVQVATGAALVAGPWLIRNALWLGNPLAPFFNRWFPNQYYHIGMEEIYADGLRHYQDIPQLWRVPLELTVHGGGNVTGMLGPALLLAPVALLSLRHPVGRRMLLAAAVLLPPAFLNVGTRFLIPALPFVAMAMALACRNLTGALPALALCQAVLCWPWILPKYCRPYAWRLSSIPVAAALRRIPADEFIARRSGDYPLARIVEREVPLNQRIFSFAGRPDAYFNREILVSYESAEANLINDVLLTPIQGFKPTARLRFEFPARAVDGVRVVQTSAGSSFWTLSEMRVTRGTAELPREPGWRLSAQPNGWEVPLAFDNSPVTRWQSWEARRPGQFVAIRFARAETVDGVTVEAAPDGDSRLKLQAFSRGQWTDLVDSPVSTEGPPPRGMRRAAALELKARRISHLMVNNTDFAHEDMARYPLYWGITQVAEAGGTHLYRID